MSKKRYSLKKTLQIELTVEGQQIEVILFEEDIIAVMQLGLPYAMHYFFTECTDKEGYEFFPDECFDYDFSKGFWAFSPKKYHFILPEDVAPYLLALAVEYTPLLGKLKKKYLPKNAKPEIIYAGVNPEKMTCRAAAELLYITFLHMDDNI